MWIILKTFESKNPLIHLFYLILIISTLSNQQFEVSADPTTIQTDNEAEDTYSIPSNMEKGSEINNGLTDGKKNIITGFLENFNSKKNIPPIRETERKSTSLKEKDIDNADNKIKNRNVEEDLFENMDQQVDDNNSETKAESITIAGTSDAIKSTTTETSNIEKNPTEGTPQNQNPVIEENPEDAKRRVISQIFKNMNAGHNIPSANEDENEMKNNDPVEKEIIIEEDPFENMELDLYPEDVEPEEQTNSKKQKQTKTNKNKQKQKQKKTSETVHDNNLETIAESTTIAGTSDAIKSTTTEISNTEDIQGTPQNQNPSIQEENPEDAKKRAISQILKNMNAGHNIPGIIENENEMKNNDPEKNPIENTEDMPHPLKPINPEDLELSSLENVEIIKIKGNASVLSETIRKEKKRAKYVEFEPDKNEAHIYCTFLGDVLKMYRKVKKRFVGKFCHAIVFGTPIIIKHHRVHLSPKMKEQLSRIQPNEPNEKESLVIVIMEFKDYLTWEHEFHNNKYIRHHLIIDIIHTVVKYKIDGIQFSNLHPEKEENKITAKMMLSLVNFFQNLQTAAKNENHLLKIGININLNGLSHANSFTSNDDLDQLVTWYTFKSISMVHCTPACWNTSTSPLDTFQATIKTLIQNVHNSNKFNMKKLIVGIQLYPSKVNEVHPYTYEELCSVSKKKWHSWCFADTGDLKSKGWFLRGTQIGGVQLYYMHSDDYRSKCGCHSFPLIRALLRGLIKDKTPELCTIKDAHN